MTNINGICVYCGSSTGSRDSYVAAANDLARALVERNIQLVYGGASIGVMGALADRVLALGGRVVGVIPKALAVKEVAHPNLSELYVTETMHERKTKMADLADGFIALPGGIGTLEELFEIWTWAQLGFHYKPCGLLNVLGYYDGLLGFLKHIADEGFVKDEHRSLLMVADHADDLLDRYASYRAPKVTRWLAEGQV
jgi:uncharacterized protein (TIGR00730 family)